MEYEAGSPKITKDGVTIAKSIFLSSREEELGCKLLKSGSGTTNIFAGDGTTSSVILTRELVREGIKAIEYGMHPIDLKLGMQEAQKIVLEELEKMSKKITYNMGDIYKVAMVSTNYDTKLSKMIAEGMYNLGKDATFTIDESKTGESYIEVSHGIKFDRGFVSSDFINIPLIHTCELQNPHILVVLSKITRISEISPVIELAKKSGRPLLVFSTDIQKEPLSTMIYNVKKGFVKCCAINIPWQAGIEQEILKDIAILTNSQPIDNNMIRSMKNINFDSLGSCNSAKITENQTEIIGAKGDKTRISERINELSRQISENTRLTINRRKIIQDRINRLSGLIGIVYIDGKTAVIRNETHDKIIDALNACKAALDRGILPGGGAALLHAAKKIREKTDWVNIDQKQGGIILEKACSMPMRKILQNASVNEKLVVNDLIEMNAKDYWMGYDAKKSIFEENNIEK